MPKKMLVNMSDPDECRLAVVDDGQLTELFIEHASAEHYVGNVYKGRVDNVEPSIQAAFVDLGLERNGFLHVSDVNPEYMKHTRVKKGGQFPRLQTVLHRGQEVVVQVTKSGIGTKGPALTTYLSLAGRFLVLMPSIKRHGVSRKIEDEEQRQRLKDALQQMKAPADMGVIVRTAGEGRTKRELQRDLAYLQRLYTAITKRITETKAPALIYQESDLVTRVIRDFFTPDTEEVIVDNEVARKKAAEFLQGIMPRYASRVKLYEGKVPLFHAYGVEKQIESIYSRRVELPGGAYVVIDQTEALVAIDVNSGSFRERRDPEENSYKLNMLAAREIARQLRLRDLGGVIVIDFIDMLDQKHRRDVEKALADELKRDKARYKVLKISDFGIVEMTRQRMRPSVRRSMFRECPYCQGTGQQRTAESVAVAALRLLPMALAREDATRVEVTVSRDVAFHLNNAKRREVAAIEDTFGKSVSVVADDAVGAESMRFVCYDRHASPSEFNPARDADPQRPAPPAARRREEPAKPSVPVEPPILGMTQLEIEDQPAWDEADQQEGRTEALSQPRPEPVVAERPLEGVTSGPATQSQPQAGQQKAKHRSRRHRGRGSRSRRARGVQERAGAGPSVASPQSAQEIPTSHEAQPPGAAARPENPRPSSEVAGEYEPRKPAGTRDRANADEEPAAPGGEDDADGGGNLWE